MDGGECYTFLTFHTSSGVLNVPRRRVRDPVPGVRRPPGPFFVSDHRIRNINITVLLSRFPRRGPSVGPSVGPSGRAQAAKRSRRIYYVSRMVIDFPVIHSERIQIRKHIYGSIKNGPYTDPYAYKIRNGSVYIRSCTDPYFQIHMDPFRRVYTKYSRYQNVLRYIAFFVSVFTSIN